MDAKNLMNDIADRISGIGDSYKRGEALASRAADKARDLYHRAEEQLPEDSMKYALFGLAGLTIAAVSYQLGKSRVRHSSLRASAQRVNKMVDHARESTDERLSSAKEATKSAAQNIEKIDFTPLYKLAKLWLIYKISL